MLLPPYVLVVRGVTLAIAGVGESTEESVRHVCAKTPRDHIAPIWNGPPDDPRQQRIGFTRNLRLVEVVGQPVRAILDMYLSRKGRLVFGRDSEPDAVVVARLMRAYPLGLWPGDEHEPAGQGGDLG